MIGWQTLVVGAIHTTTAHPTRNHKLEQAKQHWETTDLHLPFQSASEQLQLHVGKAPHHKFRYLYVGYSFSIREGGTQVVYITVKQSPMFHQMTLEELLFQDYHTPTVINVNESNTRTYEFQQASWRFTSKINVDTLIRKLSKHNESTEELRGQDRHSLYNSFYIPKKSGGLRRINAPLPDLMDALRRQKTMYEEDFHALHHTSAFAYVKKRSTVDAVKRHQANESKWFAKLDLHDFFGSTTLDFVMSMFSMVFPFSEVVKVPEGEAQLRKALELAFLDGGLPQGTPISPLITNIMMIPVDFKLTKALREYDKQKFIYTRYADDFIISSKFDFDVHKVEHLVVSTLSSFHAPFTINASKTRYGSSAGRNWNLGVMLNKDNQITVGYKKKRQFQSMMYNYISDKRKGIEWPREDIMAMQGLYSYYRMVEPEAIGAIVQHTNEKLGVDVIRTIKEDLR